jgi:hypothetical protein
VKIQFVIVGSALIAGQLFKDIINAQSIQGWLKEDKKIKLVKIVQSIFTHDTITESVLVTIIS